MATPCIFAQHTSKRDNAVVTDKLPSYGAALSELGMRARHITGGRINNRVENSHLPIRLKRTTDAAIQISWCRATISLNPHRYLQRLQRPASFDLTQNNATVPRGSYGQVGCYDGCGVKHGEVVHFRAATSKLENAAEWIMEI